MKNLMPLSDGKLMVKTYLENKSKVLPTDLTLPNTETYDSDAFVALLNQPDCVKIRLYYSSSSSYYSGNSNGNEITIKGQSISSIVNTDEEYVIEVSTKCPPFCPPENDQIIKKLL